jgi:tRNA(Ile)-lysidine synthase
MVKTDWSDFHARIHRLLKVRALLPKGDVLILAVSGGQDSICLLKLLTDLQPKWNWRLYAVHCDHRWREDSAENAQFVQQLCLDWEIPCQVVTAEEPPGTEAEARHWRYQVFARLAFEKQCLRIATGHTATDRAETLLYNLIRGSGADGLQALGWERPLSETAPHIKVVRPLLDWTRQDTANFCGLFNLPFWEDSTNQDPSYTRNRLRLQVMPQLKQHFNPNVETTLAQTAELLTADVDLLEQLAQELYAAVVYPPTPTTPWQIQRQGLRDAPLALQRRVIRRVLQQLTPAQVSFEAVEKLMVLIDAPNRTQTAPFAGGVIGVVENDWIVLRQGGLPIKGNRNHPSKG